jgi:tRNA threonylcarbamoyladenosine biosynthesis protein TsaB
VTRLLAIDTASPRFALAVGSGADDVRSLARDAGQDHSQLLLACLDELLEGQRTAVAGIVVIQGPGSYAGLRVGLATARGLALALGIPVLGVPTLEAVARSVALDEVTAIHPAGRGEFAAQRFRGGAPAEPLEAVRASDLEGTAIAGEGAGALGGTEVEPRARCRTALWLGLARLATASPELPEAVYLREPSITRPRRPRPA